MKPILLAGTCAAAICAGAGMALAEGTYLSLSAGGAWTAALYDEPFGHTNEFCLTTCGFKNLPFDTGFVGSAAFGFILARGFRLEGELGVRGNNINYTVPIDFDATTDFEGNLAGRATIFTGMANAWYDIPTGGPLTPYVGVGVGFANVNMNFTNSDTNSGSENGNVNESQTVLAYQLGAGAAYNFSPDVALTFDYRFLGTSSVWLPTGQGDEWGVKDVSGHSVMVGVRLNLGPHTIGPMTGY